MVASAWEHAGVFASPQRKISSRWCKDWWSWKCFGEYPLDSICDHVEYVRDGAEAKREAFVDVQFPPPLDPQHVPVIAMNRTEPESIFYDYFS